MLPPSCPLRASRSAMRRKTELLRGGKNTGSFGYDDVLKIAQSARGDEPFGYRSEFIQLVRAAETAAGLPPQPQ